jgi:hypothetical protein
MLRKPICLLSLTAVCAMLAAGAEQPARKEPPDKRRIREYLLRNPEIVVEALQLFGLKLKLAQAQQTQEKIRAQQRLLRPAHRRPDGCAGARSFNLARGLRRQMQFHTRRV